MDELLSEKEQIEQMRSWWQENGTWVIAGIVLGAGAIFGFGAWKSGGVETRVEASIRFEALAEEVAEDRLETAEVIAQDIYNDYGDSIYADQARLAMARLYMDQGRDQDAAGALRSLIDGGGDSEMKMVARLRLAKVLLYQGKSEDVISMLAGYEDSGFAARYSEAIGDAHFALGNVGAARTAYLAAMNQPRSTELVNQDLLQMKLNDLPEDGVESMLPGPQPTTEPVDPMVEDDTAASETLSEADPEQSLDQVLDNADVELDLEAGSPDTDAMDVDAVEADTEESME